MMYSDLRPDLITVLLQNNLTLLQLLVTIPICVAISDHLQHAHDVNAVLFNVITLPLRSIYKMVCYFHANSNHWPNLSEII